MLPAIWNLSVGIGFRCRHDGDTLGISRDAVWQMNIPAFFVLVHAQDNAGKSWRVVVRCIKQ